MNSISIIEFLLVGAIVVIQTSLARRTYNQIKLLGEIIPSLKFFSIKKYNIPIEDLQAFEPSEILQNLSSYERKSKVRPEPVYSENGEDDSTLFSYEEEEEQEAEETSLNEVSLVSPNQESNEVFDEILKAINVYLLRNKGAATDYNLIKDVVERNVDMEEEDISHTVTVPLYLGLMGTMLGIVFGLVNLFLVSDANTDFDIKGFLGGVSIAMFASFYGLFCTVANSSFNLKTARRKAEKAKNVFYTFLQTQLLPILNQSVSSSIYTLHTNLIKFNDNFTISLNRLTGMLNKNHDALIAQEHILQALESIDINEFAKANIKVLRELQSSVNHLDKFNQYLNDMNNMIKGTSRLTTSFEDLLTRSNNFQNVAEKLDSRIEESNKLIQFLNDHYHQLDERGVIIRDSVVKVEDILIKSLKQLEEHTQSKIEAIKQITVKEEDLMTQAFAENRSHISKLSLLEDLKKSVDTIKTTSERQVESLKAQVDSLKAGLDNATAELREINQNSLVYRTKNFTKSIKQLFNAKK